MRWFLAFEIFSVFILIDPVFLTATENVDTCFARNFGKCVAKNLKECGAGLSDSEQFLRKLKNASDAAENYVPIRLIPGTDIYTGIYYKLGLFKFPGWIFWTEQINEQGNKNYLQIDPFGGFYGDAEQWFFVPSKSEEGWYTLRNRRLSEAPATWSKSEPVFNDTDANGESGHYIILNRDADPEDPNTLWKPVQPPQQLELGKTNKTVYQLRIKALPDASVTWTLKHFVPEEDPLNSEDSEDSPLNSEDLEDSPLNSEDLEDSPLNQLEYTPKYIQVENRKEYLKKYKPNGIWYEDTLFTFERLESESVAEITQMEMHLFPILDQVKNRTITYCGKDVHSAVFTNLDTSPITRQVQQNFVNHGELTLKLDGVLSQFPIMKIKSSLTAKVSPPWYADSVDLNIEENYYSNDKIKIKTTEYSKINRDVLIPPLTTTEVKICREFIDLDQSPDLAVSVSLYVDISERVYRPMYFDGKFKAVYAKLPTAEFTYGNLKKLVQFGNLVEYNTVDGIFTYVPPSKYGNMELSEPLELYTDDEYDKNLRLQFLAFREMDVAAVLQGSVKGKFGYRSVVASH